MGTPNLPGLRGTLVSNGYAADLLCVEFEAYLGADTRARARRAYATWWRQRGRRLGPASSLAEVYDAGAKPALDVLGLSLPGMPRPSGPDQVAVRTRAHPLAIPVVVATWGANLDSHYTRACAQGGGTDSPWILGFDGRILRLWDAHRGWARSYVEFDLETTLEDERTFVVMWALLRAEALVSTTARVVQASARYGTAVRGSLREGVRAALELLVGGMTSATGTRAPSRSPAFVSAAFEQSLTLIYRLLFLLFAESRGLLPMWHPTYRRSYSIEALRTRAEHPGRHAGLWASLQAISRIAHAGCRAGELVVTPFNGRLFAPSRTPLAETTRLDDGLVARVLLAITTARGRRGCHRIAFGDLGVEQLGAVYESVLDYEPVVAPAAHAVDASRPAPASPVTLASTGVRRKASGTFYTPREMTDYLVRHALGPLVRGRSPDQILDLTVLDPAMGSGAFLVAACHYLAAAYERALVRDRGVMPGDVTDEDRAHYRRLVAQRCLYGVDLNPMAVQVARLSLWLATLAASRPLTFLDHRLAVGNSLVGANLDDVASRPPGKAGRTRRPGTLPLFAAADVEPTLTHVLPLRHELALVPDDDVSAVRNKERTLARLRDVTGGIGVWRRLADLWCAGWFWDSAAGPVPTSATFADLASAIRGQTPALPGRTVRALLTHVERIADETKFFHWTLEFPEVFYESSGSPRVDAGFDAVITNPPWDMVRGDTGTSERREVDGARAARLTGFARQSGTYKACGQGQANLYQLFVERCLTLTRPGGRIGLIVPWGLASDHGCSALRADLLDRCSLDALVGFENTDAVFPIHRGVRFVLLSASPGPPTRSVVCHLGVRDPALLDTIDDVDECDPNLDAGRVALTPALLEELAGPTRALPYVRGARDLRILERASRDLPALASPKGWGLAFGRELNASDDRGLMVEGGPGLAVVEGKHITPFRVSTDSSGLHVPDTSRLRSEAVRRAAATWRLAYRDVTAPTNQLTLIAALVPPGHVTVHTAFCLKTPLPLAAQAYLCAVLNSFVANFLARLWVTNHVGAALMERLPAPRLRDSDPRFVSVARRAWALREPGPRWNQRYAKLQAIVGQLFQLTRDDFAHVLGTFPLVEDQVRQRCLAEWDALASSI